MLLIPCHNMASVPISDSNMVEQKIYSGYFESKEGPVVQGEYVTFYLRDCWIILKTEKHPCEKERHQVPLVDYKKPAGKCQNGIIEMYAASHTNLFAYAPALKLSDKKREF